MYTDNRLSANSAPDVTLATTGIKHRVVPGIRPMIVRSASVTVNTAITVTAVVLNIKRRPTPGSATGEVSIGTLTIPVSTAIGKSVYKKGFAVKVSPGEEVVFDCTTAATAGAGTLCLDVEEAPEEPGNVTNMVLSA